jgi:hypothetical protein
MLPPFFVYLVVESACPADVERQIPERDRVSEQHAHDHGLRQSDDHDVVERQSRIVRVALRQVRNASMMPPPSSAGK